MVASALVHTVAPSIPFPPLAIAQAFVRAAPGGVATAFIELLGHWALRLAVLGTLAAFLAAGPLLGLLIPVVDRRLRKGPYAAAAVALVPLALGIAFLPPMEAGSAGRGTLAAEALVVLAVAAFVAGRTLARLVAARSVASPSIGGRAVGRRVVLRALWFGAAGALVGVSNLGRILRPRPNPGRLPIRVSDVTPAVMPSSSGADQAFDAVAGLSPEVTSNQDFYVVDEEIIDPDIDSTTWRLSVDGIVDRPYRLSYQQLLRLPALERYQTLECISNAVGGDLISTAKWVGVPLPAILERAGVSRGAVEVVFRAVGGYSDSLSVDQAMDESTLIAIGMNDHVLPREHGFPARLLSVGTYGMKNPKWLTGIEVVDRPYQGYWENRGWTKAAIVKTGSRIDVPPEGDVARGPVDIAGVAFAGDRGISTVEVSTDGGAGWHQAQLKRALSPVAWRLWKYRWTPSGPAGRDRILVRARDGRGMIQTPQVAAPHPTGASGYDGISIDHAAGSG
jgi:DMSO/TMAO reductase YedYZ molybdopterin-dependent catalytic subunit